MNGNIFRKYDIRGKVGTDLIISEVYNLARSIAYYLNKQYPQLKTIAVGMDGRIHSEQIKDEVCKALIDSGLNVIFIGLCPTPCMYFSVNTLPVEAGIMITASHNPKEYNGFKLMLNKQSVWADEIEEIKKLYKNEVYLKSTRKGKYSEYSIIDNYINWLADNFEHLKDKELNIAIDCCNGTAAAVIPHLVKKMNWSNVELLCTEIDGNYPNHEPNPVEEENIKDIKELLKHKNNLKFALGLDGDCDRLAAITQDGKLIPGDQLLAVYSTFLIKNHPNSKVVCDIKSSSGLLEALEKLGIKPILSPTGHAYIKDLMHKNDAKLGGELSGHYCFKDKYFGYDDGIYAILRLFELLEASSSSLDDLLKIFPQKYSSKEYRIDCQEDKKDEIVLNVKELFVNNQEATIIDIDGIRAHMPYGWGIVRASNTQPVLSIRFEANSEKELNKIKLDFLKALEPYYDKKWLVKELEISL